VDGIRKTVGDNGICTILGHDRPGVKEVFEAMWMPLASDLKAGVTVGAGMSIVTGTYAGGADYPAISDVRQGVQYDSGAKTGTLNLPAVGDVEESVTFDGGTKTGTFKNPGIANVREGVKYGAGGTEFEGTLDCIEAIPPGGEYFEAVEDAIIGLLKANLSYLKTAETYAGQLEGELDSLPVRFPAAYVVYGGSSLERVDGPTHEETVAFRVLVAAKNLKGSEAVRKGGAPGEIGAYELIKGVVDTLTNAKFGANIERFRPVKTSLVRISKSIAVYGIDFETSFDRAYEW
jgi:phage gp37-like protein